MASPDAQKQYIIHASERGLQRRFYNSLAREGESVLDKLLAFDNELLNSIIYFLKELYLQTYLRNKLLTHPLWGEVYADIVISQNNTEAKTSRKQDPSLSVWRAFNESEVHPPGSPQLVRQESLTLRPGLSSLVQEEKTIPTEKRGIDNLLRFYTQRKEEFKQILDEENQEEEFKINEAREKYFANGGGSITKQDWDNLEAFAQLISENNKAPTPKRIKKVITTLLGVAQEPEPKPILETKKAIEAAIKEKLLPNLKSLIFTGYETIINLVAGRFLEDLQRNRSRFEHTILPLSWPFLILVAPLRNAFLAAIHLHMTPLPKKVAIFQFKEGAVEQGLRRIRRFRVYVNSSGEQNIQIRIEFPNQKMNFSAILIEKTVFSHFLHFCFIQCENNGTFYNRWCQETRINMVDAFETPDTLEHGSLFASGMPSKPPVDLSHW